MYNSQNGDATAIAIVQFIVSAKAFVITAARAPK